MAGGAQVQDRQAPVTEAYARPGMETLLVGTAAFQSVHHAAHGGFDSFRRLG